MQNANALAMSALSELLKAKTKGEPVNFHVVEPTREPVPDFERMRRVILGESKNPHSDIKTGDKTS
ncbi:hypothetical protein [Ferrovibrio sp.]|uniref:hypothetical protein n=1 Tax=Ferrovibrio sp. TaxID=1917215 RepID=UPI003518B16F